MSTSNTHGETISWLMLEHVLDEIDGIGVPVDESHSANTTNDLLVGLHGVVGFERSVTGHQLVDEDTQSPPIDTLTHT